MGIDPSASVKSLQHEEYNKSHDRRWVRVFHQNLLNLGSRSNRSVTTKLADLKSFAKNILTVIQENTNTPSLMPTFIDKWIWLWEMRLKYNINNVTF